MRTLILAAALALASLAARADDGDVVVNTPGYTVVEKVTDGNTRYVWTTSSGEGGVQPTVREAKKAAKAALKDDK